MFKDSGVQITTDGKRHLGAVIGTKEFKHKYLNKKIDGWIDNVKALAQIARTQPHAAYSAFIAHLQSRWVFVTRTVRDLAELMAPLEEAIHHDFLPALLGRQVNTVERELFSLPTRHGGMGIADPCSRSDRQLECSEQLTGPLLKLILAQESAFAPIKMKKVQMAIRECQLSKADMEYEKQRDKIAEASPANIKMAIKLGTVKGASSWLTARPCHEHFTILNKSDFRDAIYLRYGWQPPNLPTLCRCGASFTVQHAMECMHGGFRGVLHNEINYLFFDAAVDTGKFKGVEMEPQLAPLVGEEEAFQFKTANKEEEARSDLLIPGFWKQYRRAFFDVTAFSPFARSYRDQEISKVFAIRERRKILEYQERIRNVDHGDFTPLVFSTSGGMGRLASTVVSKLGILLAEKQKVHPSVAIGWLRCRFSFALLRCSLTLLRGSRGRKMPDAKVGVIDLAVKETHVDLH